MDLKNELYGNTDYKPSDTPLHHNEESVDIYSGLENSPMSEGHRVHPILSPRTMESMDIYEEIIREEQEEKEATYNELKQKFENAQKQVNELLIQLKLLETKNSSLSNENVLLKKNICSLIKTARMEIVRKDEEISRLAKRSGRGSYNQNFRHSHMESPLSNTMHSLTSAARSALELQECQEQNQKPNEEKSSKELHLALTCSNDVDEENNSTSYKEMKNVTGPERKEVKCSSAERRSSRTERSKEHEEKTSKNNERSKREEVDCYRIRERRISSERNWEDERRNKTERGNRGDKRSERLVDSGDSKRGYPKQGSHRKDIDEKSSRRISEGSSKTKRSHSHDQSRKTDSKHHAKSSNDKDFGKNDLEKDRDRKRNLEEHRASTYNKSKNAIKSHKRKSNEKCKNGQESKNLQDNHLERVCVEPEVALSSNSCKTPTENIPDGKLSFMETLNLTLSPLKTPKPASDSKEASNGTTEEPSPQNTGSREDEEEFFVIDELQNSVDEDLECTKEDRSCFLKPSEQDTSKNPSSDKTETEVQTIITETSMEDVASVVEALDEKNSKSLETNVKVKESSDVSSLKESLTDVTPVTKNHPATQRTPEALALDAIPFKGDNHCKQDCFSISLSSSKVDVLRKAGTTSQNLPESIFKDDVSSSDKISDIKSSSHSKSSANMEVSSSTVSEDCCECSESAVSGQDQEGVQEVSENSNAIKTLHVAEMIKTSLASPPLNRNSNAPTVGSVVEKKSMSDSLPGFSEPDSTESEEHVPVSSKAVVVWHDEDSMMLTLRNLKGFPDPISPLSSPIRQMKKVQPQNLEKQPHVKSLNKGLSILTPDKDEVNMEMNKENKSPDSSVTGTKDDVPAIIIEDDGLEDGEIVSESEEEGTLVIQTPPRKEDKSARGMRKSPKVAAVAKRESQNKSSKPLPKKPSSANASPTTTKRRFKTVSPRSKMAVHSLDGFMEMLGSIRFELRKKYMKLHKNVTKTAFCCIVDMSHASFAEFINSVNLDTFCKKGNDFKASLHEIVSSIMRKITKNGIVNRIFEQRAGDIKQKLWKFVDGQFDFMFKEVKMALKSVSEPSRSASSKNISSTVKRKVIDSETFEKETFTRPKNHHIPKKSKVEVGSLVSEAPSHNLPRRGLGSRGKNIKAIMDQDEEDLESHPIPPLSSEKLVEEGSSVSESKSSTYVRRLSHNGSIQDKSDFELLTEQQTSSLTFNLVSDSQMGEIFKCLLQGSDLLETSVPIGENTNWSLCTPRKEGLPADGLFGIITPQKATPLKCIAPWSSVSPYKFGSSRKMLVNPAILDESCLLEVPSKSELYHVPLQSTVISQRSFSLLAEDLAVSLTIPSPLKSDSHLSFLHPTSGLPLSASNSVLSAHYCEDALLDEEDATEQEIHLSLDTDNSSSDSSPISTWDASDPSGFQFEPNLPMQAVVMEKSNDHFIVRIRRTSSSPYEGKLYEEKSSPRLNEATEHALKPNIGLKQGDFSLTLENTMNTSPSNVEKPCHTSEAAVDTLLPVQKSSPEQKGEHTTSNNHDLVPALEESSAKDGKTLENAQANVIPPKSEPERTSRKRKENEIGPKAKRSKVEGKCFTSRNKKKSKSSKDKGLKPAIKVSPSSLSAKNVIIKKGEVVTTWTRDEDRDILVELKMKGMSPKTFAALSKKLKKPPEQIEERFSQLMKLFKKKEKMEN
ncbi:hypothetical protein DNTS_033447 [Danionella cerebrum]|uniref:CASP8-associated protein 2 n=1 Tax=Danionella cerebrum TaxID=2873325 RepID=A0A553QBY7_9TELE|nr:hypothetical protein DNTS_033447 [Danionella translucida]